ncbi:MAG: DNA starvation/stationary phase protection protein [Alphaproteobacteria bacterium]|nr:DNA starvation/stationary phase protection protein [Alphaproteobacteria bacterium]
MAKKTKKPVRKSATKQSGNDAVVKSLTLVLADTYILALKTHGFHWNVEGPLFLQLHEFFGKQYDALTEKADEVAERLRALDVYAPASFAQFTRMSNLAEETKVPSAQGMVAQLLADYEILAEDIKLGIDIAGKADDADTQDLLTSQLHDADKTAWMLRAMLRG